MGKLTQRIALLMRGIRETDVAVLGAILVEPKAEKRCADADLHEFVSFWALGFVRQIAVLLLSTKRFL